MKKYEIRCPDCGAVMAQAKRCYDYQVKFMLNDKIRPLIDPSKVPAEDKILRKMNMEKSIFEIDNEHVSIEVLPCTMKACLVEDSPVYSNNIEIALKDADIGDNILGAHGKEVQIIEKEIIERECLEVKLDNGEIIKGTVDHKVWTTDGWIELQHLTDNHEVVENEKM